VAQPILFKPCQVADEKKDITGKQPTADQRHTPHSISSCFQLKSLEISNLEMKLSEKATAVHHKRESKTSA